MPDNTTLVGLPTFSQDTLRKLFPEQIPAALARTAEIKQARAETSKIDLSWMNDVQSDIGDLFELIEDADDLYSSIIEDGERVIAHIESLLALNLRVADLEIDSSQLTWKNMVPGWQLIDSTGARSTPVLPDFAIGYFDSETFVKRHQTPIIGQLLIPQGLYIWLNPGLWDEAQYEEFIDIGGTEEDPIHLFAHNTGFDGGKVADTFTGKVRWLDTYSMATASIKYGEKSLADLFFRFTGKKLAKDTRNIFVKMNHADDIIGANWRDVITYSIGDLDPLAVVAESVWPMYRANRPNAISILGHTIISTQTIPVDLSVNTELAANFDSEIDALGNQVMAIIHRCAEYHREIGPSHWTRELDWEPVAESGKGSRKYKQWLGEPKWYATIQHELKSMRKGDSITQVGAKYSCLLCLYERQTKLPLSMATSSALGLGLGLTDQLYALYKSSKNPSELGNISSAFGKEQNALNLIRSLILTNEEMDLMRVWGEFSRQVGWLRQLLYNSSYNHEGLTSIGAGVAPHATLSGRTGRGMPTLVKSSSEKHLPFSETRNRISCTPGYVFVGADFDSQENVVGAAFGESAVMSDRLPRPIGTTPYGRACYAGTKALETDYHSTIGKLLRTKRKPAKVLNLGSVYGMGTLKLAYSLIGATDIDDFDEAEKLAIRAKRIKDGSRGKDGKLSGGFESAYKNNIEDWVNQPGTQLREPFLGTHPPQDFAKRRGNAHKLKNFVCQGGAAAMLNIFVSTFTELCHRRGYSHADTHIVMTVHDEIVAVAKEDISIDVAKIFQWSHLLTWVYAFRQLGLYEICLGGAWFETVAIDRYWRKNPSDPCVTPTNPAPGFAPGTEYTMRQLYAATIASDSQ